MNALRPVVVWSVWRWIAEVLQQWHWRHTLFACLLAFGTVIFAGAPLLPLQAPARQYPTWWVWHLFQFGLPSVFAVRVADRAAEAGVHPTVAYGTAWLAVTVLGPWLGGIVAASLLGTAVDFRPFSSLWLGLQNGLPASLAIAGYAQWRAEQQARARLRAGEIERRRQSRQLQAARLLALQARVEPQLLFDTLQRIGALIGASTAQADALLADLIAMLRAMLPSAGATASTVAREFELLRTFVRVSGDAGLQAPRLILQVSPAADAAALAPMCLLPAMRTLAASAVAGWQVRADRQADQVRLSIAPLAPDGDNDRAATRQALQSIDGATLGARLAAVHGEQAVLRIDTGAEPGLYIDLPYRDDQSPDR